MHKFIKSPRRGLVTVSLATVLMAGAASAVTLDITVTNNQASGGLFLTPLLSVFHDGTFDAFDAGAIPSAGLELLAEEGEPSGVIGEVNDLNTANGSNYATAVAANPAGFGGAPVLDPGEETTIRVDLDPGSQRFATFLSMVIPSNDTFIGNDNPFAYELFDIAGNFIFTDLIEFLVGDAWDAGSEADNGDGAAFAPPTGTAALSTSDGISPLADLDFLIGRPQAPGGNVASASGLLASISITEVAPVPLPAGLPLLMGALGAFGLLKRRKARA